MSKSKKLNYGTRPIRSHDVIRIFFNTLNVIIDAGPVDPLAFIERLQICHLGGG